MRTILLALGDNHSGHKLGLMAPETKLFDQDEMGNVVEYIPELTAFQKYLWGEVYLPGLQEVETWAAGDRVVILHGGDPTHGKGFMDQLTSTRLDDQLEVAIVALRRMMEIQGTSCVRFVVGTGVHEFGEGSAPLRIAKTFKREFEGIDVGALYHGLGQVEGLNVDYAHHGPGAGIRSWLSGNNVRFYLRDFMLRSILNGEKPPDLILRHHTHQLCDETVSLGDHVSRIVVVPSLCGLGDYGRKVTRSAFELVNGMVAFEVVNGKIMDTKMLMKKLDVRTREIL